MFSVFIIILLFWNDLSYFFCVKVPVTRPTWRSWSSSGPESSRFSSGPCSSSSSATWNGSGRGHLCFLCFLCLWEKLSDYDGDTLTSGPQPVCQRLNTTCLMSGGGGCVMYCEERAPDIFGERAQLVSVTAISSNNKHTPIMRLKLIFIFQHLSQNSLGGIVIIKFIQRVSSDSQHLFLFVSTSTFPLSIWPFLLSLLTFMILFLCHASTSPSIISSSLPVQPNSHHPSPPLSPSSLSLCNAGKPCRHKDGLSVHHHGPGGGASGRAVWIPAIRLLAVGDLQRPTATGWATGASGRNWGDGLMDGG